MGCAMSTLDTSDVLLQCKQRRKAIKEAVDCRQDFAIAHVAYMNTLRNVGIALRRFSEGEVTETSPQSPSSPVLRLQDVPHDTMPDAILSPPRAHSSTSSSSPNSPPTPPVSGTVASAAASTTPAKAESQTPPITLPAAASPPASSRASHFSQSSPPHLTRASSPLTSIPDVPPSANGMFSPDRASDFSPPFYSPRHDDTDYFYRAYSPSQGAIRSPPPMPPPNASWFMYDIFDAPPIPYNLLEQRRRKQGDAVDEYEDYEDIAPSPVHEHKRGHKEEGIPDLEDVDAKEDDEVRIAEKPKAVEEKPSSATTNGKVDLAEKPVSPPKEKAPEAAGETSRRSVSQPNVASSPQEVAAVKQEPKASPRKDLVVVTTGQGMDLTGAVRHIHTHFARACRSGRDVSSMLETQTVHHNLSIVNVKDYTNVLNAITMHWWRKSSTALREAYDDNEMPECGMFGSHASTLERLHAWEKKLYDEVKAGEVVQIAFDRKCKQLHYLDARGGDPAAIDKMRAALKNLDTQLIVAVRAIHLASIRIQRLTDEELYPQLAELLGGLMSMWKVMLECHKAQAAIASEMQTIENSVAANEASEAHMRATSQLEFELANWQTQFERWINSQKNYVQALYGWLSSCHIEQERNSEGRAVSPQFSAKPAVFNLLSSWNNALVHLEEPQRAMGAIHEFLKVVHSLEIEQAGELYLKRNVERSTKDLDYRMQSLKRSERKYLEYKEDAVMGNGLPKTSSADMDTQRGLVESNKQRHTEVMLDRKQRTLSHFREHLPVVFESMASFAGEAMKTYERLHSEKSPAKENGTAHFHFSAA